MVEKRVCFDFEIDFSNGGGIQGQGFRLDIEGDDISDDDVARYIVDDMRLLMVTAVPAALATGHMQINLDLAHFLAAQTLLGLFSDDIVAQFNAFIANEDGGACDQLAHFVLRLSAKAAIQGALAVGSAEFRHTKFP